jgi:uncharacterized protein
MLLIDKTSDLGAMMRSRMLLRFRVANFRSIHEPVELVFRMPRTDGERLAGGTTVAAIYGANASGKSNLLNALAFMSSAVIGSQAQWRPSAPPPRVPFALDPSASEEPALFEVDFVLNGTRYQYGFTLEPGAVGEEWLYDYPSSRKRVLFEREGQEFHFGRGLRGPNRTIADLVRKNSLFMSAAASNNHEELLPIYHWFETIQFSGVRSGAPDVTGATERLLLTDQKEEVRKLLVFADLGITDVSAKQEDVDPDLAKAMESVLNTLWSKIDDAPAEQPAFMSTATIVELDHRNSEGETARLTLNDESRGTQMWFAHIGPLLHVLRDGGLLVVDELDASLHPRLSSEIVRLFSDTETNPHNAQIIFSTHDTTLLDRLTGQVLDRDDVWFTEKTPAGATILYPLSEFKPRKNEAIERRYLEGRYGGVPIIDLALAASETGE